MPKLFISFAVMAAIPMVFIGMFILFTANTQKPGMDEEISPRATITELPLPSSQVTGEIELFSLGSELDTAEIYSLETDGDILWIGSGKGLLRFAHGNSLTQYRTFADAAFEWVRGIAIGPTHLVADVLVANGSTGGSHAGTHIFDRETGKATKISPNSLSNTWVGDTLWQRPVKGRELVSWEEINGTWTQQVVELDSRLCSEAYMTTIENEIWIAQQGTVRFRGGRRSGSTSRAVPCGLIRYDPTTGDETSYDEESGMNSGFGRDVVGDANAIYVTHSIKHGKLSRLDRAGGTWRTVAPYGSANSLVLTNLAVWLASPDGRNPLIRIDRQSEKRTNITGIPSEYYVRAMAADDTHLWIGLSKHTWDRPTYSVGSALARVALN